MTTKTQKIAILGAAESGVGTAILATQQGFDVWVSDYGQIKPKYKESLNEHNINWEEGKHSEDKILDANMVMKSPGIPENADIIQKIRKKGIAVVSEIEFASRYTDAFIIAITGSNGKTIIKEWLYQILQQEKKVIRSPRSFNSQLGVPLSLWPLNNQYEIAIIFMGPNVSL